MNLCVIPARGGSRRIPRKNIKNFFGKPIISYVVEKVNSSKLFDEVMVSTEDAEIAEIARNCGASVPFMRTLDNADDFTGPGDVVNEVLTMYAELGRRFEAACCVYPTAVLMKVTSLSRGYEMLSLSKYDAVLSAGKFSSPIWRSLKVSKDGHVEMFFPEYETARSQDLPEAYFDAGQFYWFRPTPFLILGNKNVFGNNRGLIVLSDHEVQDIDTLEDWKMAEIKFALSRSYEGTK